MTNQEAYEELCDKAEKYDKLVKAIEDIELELVQYIQNGVIKISSGTEHLFLTIDKHTKELM